MEFNEIRNAYIDAREAERRKIVNFFKEREKEGFTVCANGGSGAANYKSQGRLKEEFDLRIWKWVEIEKNSVHFLISLQPFERDKNNNDLHVLMDQIGIYVYTGDYSATDAQTKMMVTQIGLPMDVEKLNKLAEIIKSLSECEIYKIQAQFEKIRSENDLF